MENSVSREVQLRIDIENTSSADAGDSDIAPRMTYSVTDRTGSRHTDYTGLILNSGTFIQLVKHSYILSQIEILGIVEPGG